MVVEEEKEYKRRKASGTSSECGIEFSLPSSSFSSSGGNCQQAKKSIWGKLMAAAGPFSVHTWIKIYTRQIFKKSHPPNHCKKIIIEEKCR
jgi:hypothetical protein